MIQIPVYFPSTGKISLSNAGTNTVNVISTGVSITGSLTTSDAGITNTNTYLGTGQLRVGGGSDHGANTVLSIAPGVVKVDAPGVSGGRLTLDNSGNLTVAGNFYTYNDRNYLARAALRVTSAGDNASTLDISVSNGTTSINSNYYSGGGDNTIIIGTYANYTNQLVLKSNGRIGIGNTNPAYTLDVNGGIRTTGLSLADYYSAQFTTNASWTSFQNVIPANTVNAYETYLVEIRWEYNGGTYAPYYADAAFLWKPVPTNATGYGNTIDLQTSCHVDGNYIISVANQNVLNASCAGLALKFNFSTSSPSYVLVKAKRIAI
jgi:hypothetical protein